MAGGFASSRADKCCLLRKARTHVAEKLKGTPKNSEVRRERASHLESHIRSYEYMMEEDEGLRRQINCEGSTNTPK